MGCRTAESKAVQMAAARADRMVLYLAHEKAAQRADLWGVPQAGMKAVGWAVWKVTPTAGLSGCSQVARRADQWDLQWVACLVERLETPLVEKSEILWVVCSVN